MSKLKPDDVVAVKAKGFLRNRGTDKFSGRILAKTRLFGQRSELFGKLIKRKRYGLICMV